MFCRPTSQRAQDVVPYSVGFIVGPLSTDWACLMTHSYQQEFIPCIHIVQLSNGIFLLKRVSRYGRCFMIDSGSKGCPEQESAGCHFGTLGRNFLRAKTKWPPNISRYNMIFQLMKPGTSVIPHFYVILTGQSISCIILMTQGHLQGQKDNFKVKEAKIQFLTNKDKNMCNTSFTWDFI